MCVVSLTRHNRQCFFGCLTLPSALNLPLARSSASHFLVVFSPSVWLSASPLLTPCLGTYPHNKPCHTPNPSPLSFSPPSMTVHGPTWCRGRLRSTRLRALYSPNGMTSVSYSACATTQSGLSPTLLQEGCCGTDPSSLPLLLWELVLILLPVTFLNAPRTPGLPGSHAQHLSVQRSSIA